MIMKQVSQSLLQKDILLSQTGEDCAKLGVKPRPKQTLIFGRWHLNHLVT